MPSAATKRRATRASEPPAPRAPLQMVRAVASSAAPEHPLSTVPGELTTAPGELTTAPGEATSGTYEVGQVRALLHSDRRDAGELRSKVQVPELAVSSYTTPMSVLWRRYLRAHRKELKKLGRALAAAVVLLAAAYGLIAGLTPARTQPSAPGARSQVVAKSSSSPASSAIPAPRLDAGDTHGPATAPLASGATARDAAHPHRASAVRKRRVLPITDASPPRMRLVRADALLRHPSQQAALEARALLEVTLPQLPRDAHGRAALAEACLRLHDAACAREAIADALELRPRRSRYLALSQRIERAF